MHRKTWIAALVVAGLSATAAWAATPAETISARQQNFKQMGRAQKAIGDQLKQSAPDVATIRANAGILVQSAGRVHGGFPRGTGPEAGVKTVALPIIWQQSSQFRGKANQLVGAARAFQRAAAGGNVNAIKAAFPAVGGACKGCHDTFKGKS
jgi:cytochrome c556